MIANSAASASPSAPITTNEACQPKRTSSHAPAIGAKAGTSDSMLPRTPNMRNARLSGNSARIKPGAKTAGAAPAAP
jgi:hypothetical protein